jgi:2-polyprenyl-6-methoxyphenol hydroxylase-like FAD-dependent oxidoreductase
MKVIIIGAGIGGSCLAHGLLKSGIDVTVFERNSRNLLGLPGYGIHINPFGQQALQECLPEKSWDSFLQKSVAVGGQSRFFDEKLHLLADVLGSHRMEGKVVDENRLSISRAELREVLLQHLDGAIRWEKTFDRYELRVDGKVDITLNDGQRHTADVLIGADASNSRVRKQLLPTFERISAGVSVIVGRTELAWAESLPNLLIDGSPNTIMSRADDSMFVSMWRAPVDTKVLPAEAEIAPFVVWAYVVADDALPLGVDKFSHKELLDLTMLRTGHFDKDLRHVIGHSELESVSLVPLKTMPRLPLWHSSAVTLIGDAVHNMTPMAGIGANTALRDARLLSRALVTVANEQVGLAEAISQYETAMRLYANEAVMQSLTNAHNAVSRSRLKRTVFRTLLRLAERFPGLERQLFPPAR